MLVAVVAAAGQAAAAVCAAASTPATLGWVYLGQYGAALTMAVAVNIATSSAQRSSAGGDVTGADRPARCGAHHYPHQPLG